MYIFIQCIFLCISQNVLITHDCKMRYYVKNPDQCFLFWLKHDRCYQLKCQVWHKRRLWQLCWYWFSKNKSTDLNNLHDCLLLLAFSMSSIIDLDINANSRSWSSSSPSSSPSQYSAANTTEVFLFSCSLYFGKRKNIIVFPSFS